MTILVFARTVGHYQTIAEILKLIVDLERHKTTGFLDRSGFCRYFNNGLKNGCPKYPLANEPFHDRGHSFYGHRRTKQAVGTTGRRCRIILEKIAGQRFRGKGQTLSREVAQWWEYAQIAKGKTPKKRVPAGRRKKR